MPGKELSAGARSAASLTTRSGHSSATPYHRRPTDGTTAGGTTASSASSLPSHTDRLGGRAGRGGVAPSYAPATVTGAKPHRTATPSPQPPQPPAAVKLEPACASCVACYTESESVVRALTALLANTKELFLDDVAHHYSGDEAWIRLLRSLGHTDTTWLS